MSTQRDALARVMRMHDSTDPEVQARFGRWWDEGDCAPDVAAHAYERADAALAALAPTKQQIEAARDAVNAGAAGGYLPIGVGEAFLAALGIPRGWIADVPAPTVVDVVFDGPPGPVAGRFVDTEDTEGRGVGVGEWVDRGNGTWALRLTVPTDTVRRG